jgi:hypothetical protein
MILVLLAVMLWASPAFATTYYVSKTASNGYAVGSNANSCAQAQNKATPKNTIIGSATAAVEDCVIGGDTVIVNQGTYTNEMLNIPGGSASGHTIIMAEVASARPLIVVDKPSAKRGVYCTTGAACSYITIQGFDITGYDGVKLNGDSTLGYPHHVHLINNIIHDTVNVGWIVSTSNMGYLGGDHLIQGNEWYNIGIGTPGYAPGMNTIYNPGNRTIVEKNRFHNVGNAVAIWHSGKYLQNIIVRYNQCYDIGLKSVDTWMVGYGGFACVGVSTPGGGHKIHNNTIWNFEGNTGSSAININPQWDDAGLGKVEVDHNSFYQFAHGTSYAVRQQATGGGPYLIRNNIAISAGQGFVGGTQSGNRTTGTASAIWTDPTNGVLTLKAGSAAIDAGASIGGASNGSPDQGAYETPAFSACEVKNGEPTKVYFRFMNNVRPPMSPASGVAGVTFRRNTANNAPTSFVRSTDNEYYAVITTSQSAGETIDMSINPATTNLTDSSLNGGSRNQPFVSTITNQSCTNNLGGAPVHTYTQARYELHGWRGSEDAPDILPHGFLSTGVAENFPNYKVYPGSKLRVRLAVVCGVVDCPKTTFRPYFSTGGAYAPITDDFSVNDIKMCGIPSGTDMPTNASPTTNQLSTGGTFVPGGIVFTANDVPEIAGLNVGYKTEMEYCMEIDADASGYFDLRLYLDSGAALNVFAVTPRLAVVPVSAGGM